MASSSRLRRLLFGAVAVSLSGALSVVGFEIALRLLRDPNSFYPYQSNTTRVFFPSQPITPGVTGRSYFTTNGLGTRGPEWSGERVKILIVGGSTTACTVLDDAEAWPQLLMDDLNADAGNPKAYWVTNSGIDGLNSQHHLMHALYLLPQLPQIDYMIVYAGLNDVGSWLYRESFDPHDLDDPAHFDSRVGEAFRVSRYSPADFPWYKRLELWKRAGTIKARILSHEIEAHRSDGALVQDAELRWMEKAQEERHTHAATFVHRAKMETLPAALDAYGDTLKRIIEASRRSNTTPVLVAQAIQHQFLDETERRRLWMGAMDGGKTYVKEEQMLELLQKFNHRMREVAAAQGVPFIDLPAVLVGEHDIFYDGVHLNERGARVVARAIANELERGVLPKPR
jgi:lysophospholipase L1-like esterase